MVFHYLSSTYSKECLDSSTTSECDGRNKLLSVYGCVPDVKNNNRILMSGDDTLCSVYNKTKVCREDESECLQVSNDIFNISSQLKNNSFDVIHPTQNGLDTVTITIPDGQYDIYDIVFNQLIMLQKK